MRQPVALLLMIFAGCAGVALADSAWSWRDPLPTGRSLTAVTAIDANTATLVGDIGTILRTIDGGATWTSQWPDTFYEFNGVSFTDANTGTVVGANYLLTNGVPPSGEGVGRILRTTDGGATWTLQVAGGQALFGVSFTDARTGTAVGDSGTILRTTDGGATWKVRSSGTTLPLRGVTFTDANTGTVVGLNGTILRTTDGGATWIKQSSGLNNGSLVSVSFMDANTGVVVGDDTVLRTTDGGAVWTLTRFNTAGSPFPSSSPGVVPVISQPLRGVSLVNAQAGFAVGATGTILRTIDGGATWTKLNRSAIAPSTSLNGVAFTDPRTGTVVGSDGTILRTTEGGATWTSQWPAAFYTFYGVFFTDANTGTVVGANANSGRILRTTDGGLNWKLQYAGGFPLYGVSFTDANRGVAVGVAARSCGRRTAALPGRRHRAARATYFTRSRSSMPILELPPEPAARFCARQTEAPTGPCSRPTRSIRFGRTGHGPAHNGWRPFLENSAWPRSVFGGRPPCRRVHGHEPRDRGWGARDLADDRRRDFMGAAVPPLWAGCIASFSQTPTRELRWVTWV
jgi:photosystem II stability/assembly factor-like uncharacterized protein